MCYVVPRNGKMHRINTMWKRIAPLAYILMNNVSTAWAEESRKIYVAELNGGSLDLDTLKIVSDQIRQGARDILEVNEYDVMTREDILVYFQENNQYCSDFGADCHMKLGNTIDAQYIVYGDVTKFADVISATIKLYAASNGRMLSMTTVRADVEGELITLMRAHSQILFKTGLSATEQLSTGTPSEQLLFLRSSSDFAPSDQIEAGVWEEERRQELTQQFIQIRKEVIQQRQQEATRIWKELQPMLSSSNRQKHLKKFINKHESAKVVVDYISPETGEIVQSTLSVPIPEIIAARQLLFTREAIYSAQLIPSGSFLMGCTGEQGVDCDRDEKPTHSATISQDFYMMKSEVTQELYERVMGTNPSEFRSGHHPVEQVRWFDVIKFANKLSSMEGLEQCYTINRNTVTWSDSSCRGWRLPTETEWEYAARGGDPHKYAGGWVLDDVAWYATNSRKQTHGVCSKLKNGYGLCDMSGNVYEWVWDWKVDYERFPTVDQQGPDAGSTRVIRGGSWDNDAQYVRVSNRNARDPMDKDSLLGFRLCRLSPS